MIEESSPSDPPPPDIRPCRRITQRNNNNHNNTANESLDALHGGVSTPHPKSNTNPDQAQDRHSDTRDTPRRRLSSLTRHVGFHTVLLVAFVALAFATPSAASPIGPHTSNTTTPLIANADTDAWTSGPDITYTPRHTWEKAPVISFLRWAFCRVTAIAAGWAGYDLVPSSLASGMSDLGLAKRDNLSTGEIVEACMIPILVVLSGIFAGLTLG
jgi:hypothetical protein